MILTIVTRSNSGYINDKCTLDCERDFAVEVAKKMFDVSRDNKYIEIYQGSKLYFGDSRVRTWIKMAKSETDWNIDQKYDLL